MAEAATAPLSELGMAGVAAAAREPGVTETREPGMAGVATATSEPVLGPESRPAPASETTSEDGVAGPS